MRMICSAKCLTPAQVGPCPCPARARRPRFQPPRGRTGQPRRRAHRPPRRGAVHPPPHSGARDVPGGLTAAAKGIESDCPSRKLRNPDQIVRQVALAVVASSLVIAVAEVNVAVRLVIWSGFSPPRPQCLRSTCPSPKVLFDLIFAGPVNSCVVVLLLRGICCGWYLIGRGSDK
jgi:hypothetical protein